MEAQIKYVHFEDQGMGFKPTLCCLGTKLAHCVINDEIGVRVIRMPLRDVERAGPVLYRGKPYPLPRFRESMLRIGRRKGITQAALELLERPDMAPEASTDDPPAVPIPAKVPKAASKAPVASGGGIIASLAVEFKLEPGRIRKLARAAGLAAPYTDADALRKILSK